MDWAMPCPYQTSAWQAMQAQQQSRPPNTHLELQSRARDCNAHSLCLVSRHPAAILAAVLPSTELAVGLHSVKSVLQ